MEVHSLHAVYFSIIW